MATATNPDTGEVLSLDQSGKWIPATTAVNPETKEMMALDNGAWVPVVKSKGVLNYVDDAVRSMASGITFGWADEFSAKMDEMIGRGGTYDKNLAAEQSKDAQIPITIKLPGEIAGAVGSTVLVAPLGVVKAIAATTKGLPAWLRFAGLGAAEGAVAGAGGASPGSRTSGAATGAAVGGAIGAATPAVVNAVGSAYRGVTGAIDPKTGAAADIGRAIVRDEMTPASVADNYISAAAVRPGTATIADAGGENVKGLVERIAQTPGAGRTTVIPALTNRQTGQLNRISGDLAELTGTSQSAFQATEQAISSRASAASPLYEAAYNAGDRPIWSPGLERLSSSPTVRDAMSGAVRVWRDNAIADGYGAMNPGAVVKNGGMLEFLNGKVPVLPNIQFWDYTKRIIDDQIGAALRAGQDQKARTLTRLNQALRSELDTAVPEYRAARDAWAGPSAYINAVADGRSILSKSMASDEFTSTFRALSPSEQDGFRVGAVSSIISKMGNDASGLADMTKYLRSPEMRAKIAAIMPTPDAANYWNRRLNFEIDSSKLAGRSLGNSATARRLAEMNDAKGVVGDLVMDALVSGPASVSILGKIFKSGPKWLRDTLRSRTDKEIADILLNPERAGELPNIISKMQGGRPRITIPVRPGYVAAGVTAAE